MWLKSVRNSMVGLALFAGFALCAAGVNAASVTITNGSDVDIVGLNTTVVIDGDTTPDDITISVNETNDFIVIVTQGGAPVTGVTLAPTSGGGSPTSFTTDGTGIVYSLRYSFIAGTNYTLSSSLNDTTAPGNSYQVRLSAVPLPAAAWMFLSMLFGGAWIKRRSARSKGGVVATA